MSVKVKHMSEDKRAKMPMKYPEKNFSINVEEITPLNLMLWVRETKDLERKPKKNNSLAKIEYKAVPVISLYLIILSVVKLIK